MPSIMLDPAQVKAQNIQSVKYPMTRFHVSMPLIESYINIYHKSYMAIIAMHLFYFYNVSISILKSMSCTEIV